MVTSTEAPAAMGPRPTEPVHAVPGVHPDPVQDWAPFRWESRVSVRVTGAASDGPLLVTVMVKVSSLPAMTVVAAALRSATSALRFTVTVAVSWSLAATGSAVAVVPIFAVFDRDPPSV